MPNVPCHVRFVVAFALWSLFVSSAFAQGTDEQTAACSGDAFTLCRGYIPDVAKITACMKAHEAQLSPRCRAQFHRATAPQKASEKQAATVLPPRSPANIRKHPAEVRAHTSETAENRDRSRAIPKRTEPLAHSKAAAATATAAPALSVPERIPGLAAYRASIASSCRNGLIDPYTCRSTLDALSLLE